MVSWLGNSRSYEVSFNCRVRAQVWLMMAVPRARASRAGTEQEKNIQICAPLPDLEISKATGTPRSRHDWRKASASDFQSASSKSTARKLQVSSVSSG